jgi:hypothetical protein
LKKKEIIYSSKDMPKNGSFNSSLFPSPNELLLNQDILISNTIKEEKTICYFCNKNLIDNDAGFSINLYKVYKRSSRQVYFETSKIEITRCSNCKIEHLKYGKNDKKYISVFALIGLIFAVFINVIFILIGIIIGVIVGYLISIVVEYFLLKKNGIKTASGFSLDNHPIIKKLIKEGWQINYPSQYS